MTLYKHGVGFFERRASFEGEEIELSFRVAEMNDILKSLTAIDVGGGKVLGVDYATPQSREERLAGCSIRLGDERSLRDLLAGLRGRRVALTLDGEPTLSGRLLGLDEPPDRQPMAATLVSVLCDGTDTVRAVPLGGVWAVEILDERGAADLRFFLRTALTQETYRQVTVRLTPGEHELAVSYIAPAPLWRVSYRLVVEPEAEDGPKALLLGWGIFDNRLEEDLQEISLSLVAGMPISFVYDLYTPLTPERPVVQEKGRVAPGPVGFEGAPPAPEAEERSRAGEHISRMSAAGELKIPAAMQAVSRAMKRADLAQALDVAVQGKEQGELFQYQIETPVTVGRGQSAMVPIVSTNLDCRKDLLYNASKMPNHPVATVRMKNTSGLTLERGPVTVLEDGEYVGEAVLPFTSVGGEIVVPYAVELGVNVRESTRADREVRRLYIQGAYLRIEAWEIRRRTYHLTNRSATPHTVLVEHPRRSHYQLFESPEPKEQVSDHLRFEVQVPAWEEYDLKIQERRLIHHREEIQKQSHKALHRYLTQGLLNRRTHDRIVKLLMLYDALDDNEKKQERLEERRKKIHETQARIQKNMEVLTQPGKEAALRARYVEQLEASEAQLRELDQEEAALEDEREQIRVDIAARLEKLGRAR
jgi:hypothetical protein